MNIYEELSHKVDVARVVNRLDGASITGIKDPIVRIGQVLQKNPFFAYRKDHIAEALESADAKGIFNNSDTMMLPTLMSMAQKFIDGDNGSEGDLDEFEEFLLRAQTDKDIRKKFIMKWYKVACKAVDNIPEFTNQFKVQRDLLPSKDGQRTMNPWRNESVLKVNQRHVFANMSLLPLTKFTVTDRFITTDLMSKEVLLIDISGSMRGNNIVMALLYTFNRIQHVRDKHLRLKITLFDDEVQLLSVINPSNGETISILDENTSEEVFSMFEDLVYEKVSGGGGTNLTNALNWIQKEGIKFGDIKAKQKTVVTIVTDDGSSTNGFIIPRDTIFNSLLAGNNYDLVNLSKKTKGYTAQLSSLLKRVS